MAFTALFYVSNSETSRPMPMVTCLGLYYGFTIIIVSLATAMTVMTLNIHHHGTSGRPVPPLVRTVCFRWLRRLLCLGVGGAMRQSRHQLQNVIEVCRMRNIHRVREKRDRQYFGHNFDKFKHIVIFCKK